MVYLIKKNKKNKEKQEQSKSLLDKIRGIYLIFRSDPLFCICSVFVFLFLVSILCNIAGLLIIRDSWVLFYITFMSRIIFIKFFIRFNLIIISRSTIY